MAAFFGSSAKMPVRRPGGDIGYTSKRRHDLLTRMGIPLDAQGRIITGGGGQGLQPFGGGANPWGQSTFGGGAPMGNPFAAMGSFFPGMLMAHAMGGMGGGASSWMNPFLAYGMQQQQQPQPGNNMTFTTGQEVFQPGGQFYRPPGSPVWGANGEVVGHTGEDPNAPYIPVSPSPSITGPIGGHIGAAYKKWQQAQQPAPSTLGGFGDRFRSMLTGGMQGSASTDGGSRGPMPSMFNALARFSGPFGNGGGAILPDFANQMRAY